MTRARTAPLLAASVALLAACTGAEAPTVEILGAAPQELVASDDGSDDLTLTLRYADADGDLGQGTATVIDCRAPGLVTIVDLPRIANDEAVKQGVSIAGELALVLSDVGHVPVSGDLPPDCVDLGADAGSDSARPFCVFLTDAAGHESEGACSALVTVLP
ncbi:MAG: hypothetical protein R3B70_09675 [Polyangiaceae bacterium]